MSVATETNLAPWAQSLPVGWEARRLGVLADIRFSNVDKLTEPGEIPVRLCNYTDVYKNPRVTASIDFMRATAVPREIERFQVRKGDVIATKDSESPYDIAVSALIAEEMPGVLCGYHLAMIRADCAKLDGGFLGWVQASKQIRSQYEAQATGVTRFALSQSAFKEALIPVPPLDEQRRIAAWLDEKTAKIDRLIALRRKQILLVSDKAKDIARRLLLSGTDDAVCQKAANLRWVESIPENWECKRFKFIVRGTNAGEVIDRSYWDSGDENLYTCQREILKSNYAGFPSWKRTGPSDILVTRNGTPYVHLPVVGSMYSNVVQRCEIKGDHHVPYIAEILGLSASIVVAEEGYGVSIASFSFEKWANAMILLPPKDQQIEIMRRVEDCRARHDRVIEMLGRQIDSLLQFRTSLIHEAVTGQVIP